MPAFKQRIAVEMEDGESWEAVADQRDLAKYEVQDFYGEGRVHTMIRFIAWAASYRTGQTKLSWPKFDAACIEAGDPADDTDEALDPTQLGQPAGS